jgi:hypothetical protein
MEARAIVLAIRSRIAQTGEKYTEARRVLLAGGDSGHAEEDPDATIPLSEGSLASFTGQAYSRAASRS